MTRARLTNADDVRTGNAVSADRTILGVPLSNLVVDVITPTAAAANNICTSQAVAGAANATLNGSLASGTPAVVTLDVERNLQTVSSNAGDTTQTLTVFGKDRYGAPLQEVISLNGTTIVTSAKVFKTISRIAVSAALAGNLTVGTSTKLGLAFAPKVGCFIRGRLNEDTADAGSYAAPTRTASTSTSAATRGTYITAGAMNGTNVYTLLYVAANGPQDTDAYGLAHYNG